MNYKDQYNRLFKQLWTRRQAQKPQEEVARQQKFTDALQTGNWSTAIEVLSTFDEHAKRRDGQDIGVQAMILGRWEVIKYLVLTGWHVNLDMLLRHIIIHCKNALEGIEVLCQLGATEIIDYWGICNEWSDRVMIYGILLEHNVVTPRLLFYKAGVDIEEIQEISQDQKLLAFSLDIPRDRCEMRSCWLREKVHLSTRVTNHREVLGIVKLYARNGALIAVDSSLRERLPDTRRRVSALMAAALQPAPLQALCRNAIRLVGPKQHFKKWVLQLGLPGRLPGYVCSSEA